MALSKLGIEIDDELLKDASDNETDCCIEFYKRNLWKLKEVPLSELYLKTLLKIACTCKSTESFSSAWMMIVESLISGNGRIRKEILDEIQASAEANKEIPLYHAMRTTLTAMNQNVGNLIQVLLDNQLLHVLEKIKPHIQDLLETFERRKNNSFNDETKELQLNIPHAVHHESDCINTVNRAEKECVFSNFHKDQSKNSKALLNSLCISDENVYVLPVVPKSYQMTVFIPHLNTTESSHVARQFSSKLRDQYHVDARAMCEVEHLMAINSRFLDSVLPNMDFILPIVCPDYFNTIIRCSSNLSFEHQCDDFRRNRYINHYLCTEYELNNCLNFRCRSVITGGTDVMQVMRFPLFYPCFELMHIEKLIKQLCYTKKIIKKLNVKR